MRNTLNGFIVLMLASSGMTAIAPSWSQGYPVKPIRIIAGAPPGGGGDVILRPIAQKLSEALGQQVIVDNRPGAGSTIAAQLVAASPPDGYTVFQASASGFSISPFLLKRRPYDPVHDFSPITLIATAPLMITVHPSLPVKSVKELVAFARARPSQLLYSSNGKGSFSHFSTEMFLRSAGITMVHVPYKGGTGAVMSAISGETQMVITAVPTLLSQVRAGRLRALAVTSAKRSFAVPETPTVAESQLPGFETVQWYGIFSPRHTSAAVTDRLHAEIRKAVDSSAVKGTLVQEGAEPAVAGPQALAEFLKSDIARWQTVIRQANIALE
jgi:tripartite-type tricarboxylate transporter receptor subunit TctC